MAGLFQACTLFDASLSTDGNFLAHVPANRKLQGSYRAVVNIMIAAVPDDVATDFLDSSP